MTGPIAFPPEVPTQVRLDLLDPLNDQRWTERGAVGREYRRLVTRYSPVRFALTYLAHHLSSPETGGRLSFSPLHLALARGATRWARPRAEAIREGWIAPRGAAKSTWAFLILPLWALAHGHRRFILAFADAGPQAELHLANLRAELDQNMLLAQDFPELSASRGRGSADNARRITLLGGGTMVARGMDSRTLGAKIGGARPDLIIGDDVEPDGGNYSPEVKAKRLRTLVDGILPMNERAAVMLCGTVTMHGSIMHDLVRTAMGEPPVAQWVRDEGFTPRYFPPIRTGPDGARASLWPERWSLSYLESIERTQSYALNFLNRPRRPGEDGVGFRPELFVIRAAQVSTRELFVDPAVTSAAKSDRSALAVVGQSLDRRHAVVEYVRGYRITPGALADEIRRLCRSNGIRRVNLERNQGGEAWAEILSPLPPGVTLATHHSRTPKDDRIRGLLDRYERRAVWHTGAHADYVAEALDWPRGAHDDLVDVVAEGTKRMLEVEP